MTKTKADTETAASCHQAAAFSLASRGAGCAAAARSKRCGTQGKRDRF